MGLLWLVIWLIFPYNRLRRGSTITQENLAPVTQGGPLYSKLFRQRGLYAFSIAKALTDPIWWFYLFYLPKFLNENYGLGVAQAKVPIIIVYACSSVGSIGGGWLSGARIKRGHSVNSGRKMALLLCALCVLPIMLVPEMGHLFHANAWPAVALFSLAAAAHQGWSCNLYATSSDMFPSTAVSSVVGIGGAAGAAGGAIFTWIVKSFFALHPLLIFVLAGFAYVVSLAIFQWLVPHLGQTRQSPAAAV
jgi:ACS family hexuronate transporter-like MFS transporter